MTRSVPPNPKQFRNLQQWSEQLYEFFLAQTRITEKNDPQPVLLSHRVGGFRERAAVDGLLIYDPVYETIVYSQGGKWWPSRTARLFEFDYQLGAAVNGASVVAGANKIPFNTAEVDLAPWATADAANNEFDLLQGTYYIDGFYTLTKVSGGAKSFTTYLANPSDLSTPVGTVQGATLYMPSSLPNDFTTISRYAGFVNVPEGGGSYCVVCRASDTNVRFGTAHNLTGYTNLYAHLSIQLVGLNE